MTYKEHLVPIAMYMAIGADTALRRISIKEYTALSDGLGNIGVMLEIVLPVAEWMANRLVELAPEEYPGVLEYEVAEPMGMDVIMMASKGSTQDDILRAVEYRLKEFFSQGERS